MSSTNYFVVKRDISRQIFQKSSTTSFNKIFSSGIRAVPWGRTDKQDEANSRLWQIL